jgi:hypothetical protein
MGTSERYHSASWKISKQLQLLEVFNHKNWSTLKVDAKRIKKYGTTKGDVRKFGESNEQKHTTF